MLQIFQVWLYPCYSFNIIKSVNDEMAAFMQVRTPKHYRRRVRTLESDYHSLFRFNEANVEWLADHFLGNYNETRGGALTSKQRMEIFLRFVSDPGYQLGISKDIGVHRTTVSKTINAVLEKIVAKAHLWIKFPTGNEINRSKRDWSELYTFPCTHIFIMKPSQHGDEYVNRKGKISINVQATCNAKEKFTSVDARWPGSVHDNRILKRSDVYSVMNNQQTDAVLLGDSGYGIMPWLLTPFRHISTPQEAAYNTLLKSERVIIERCFGQLKRRFPVLHYMRVKLEKVPKVIISCVVLHNIAKYLQDPIDEHWHGEEEQETEDTEHEVDADDHLLRQLGQRRRDEIKNVIYNNMN